MEECYKDSLNGSYLYICCYEEKLIISMNNHGLEYLPGNKYGLCQVKVMAL
jgi:hypothetical protein